MFLPGDVMGVHAVSRHRHVTSVICQTTRIAIMGGSIRFLLYRSVGRVVNNIYTVTRVLDSDVRDTPTTTSQTGDLSTIGWYTFVLLISRCLLSAH